MHRIHHLIRSFMKHFSGFIPLLSVLLLLSRCGNTVVNKSDVAELPLQKYKSAFVGEWKYDNTIWYCSELTIIANGSFIFHDHGCYGQNFTKGNWTVHADTLLLWSDASFKPKDNSQSVLQKSKAKKSDTSILYVGFKDDSLSKFSSPDDTSFVCFEKVAFKLKNDTLYYLSSNDFLKEHNFYKLLKIAL